VGTELLRLVPSLALELPGLPLDRPPWLLVADVARLIEALAASRALRELEARPGGVFIHPDAEVEDGATIRGPAVLSAGCFVATTAYLRDGVILGPGTHVGPAVELKATIVAGRSAIAHLGYVGNSVIGSRVNLEAGVVVANHLNESPGATIRVRWRGETIDTGQTKFGAVLGDGARVGANSVLSPGTILEAGAIVPRLTLVST
jgi:NDP-sugar pyrophosphorylase family protein